MISAHVPPPPPPEPPEGHRLTPVTPIYLAGIGPHPQEPSLAGGTAEGGPEESESYEPGPEGTPEALVDKSRPWTLADVMSAPVLTARCQQSLREVVQLLAERRIAGVPVVDEEGRLAGVLSQSDVAAHVARSWAEVAGQPEAAGFFQSLWINDPDAHERMSAHTPVEQVMAPYVYYATPDASIDEAADLMLKHNIHRVVVMRGSEIVGIVTSLDLLRAYRS